MIIAIFLLWAHYLLARNRLPRPGDGDASLERSDLSNSGECNRQTASEIVI